MAKVEHKQVGWYILFAFSIVALALAGYVGFILYPKFDLPAVSGIGLLVLAAAASVASFFSPCSFPLLVGLLARETGAEKKDSASLLRPALRFAAALSVGASLFLLLLGAAIALGGSFLFKEVTFTSTPGRIIRLVVGALLIILGLIQVGIIPFSFRGTAGAARSILQTQAHLRRERTTLGFAILGFGYLLAGFG
jgi:cytochrome c-type biogenesis protein